MKDIGQLQYIVISGKYPAEPYAQYLHNKAFLFWKDFWNGVFKENKTDDTVNPDNFARQDMVTLIMNGDEIVGLHLYSVFHIESEAALNHSYFTHSFNENYIKQLREHQSKVLMSMEYLSVDPQWRKKDCGISLASVLLGLACRQMKYFRVDALIAPTRADNKVSRSVAEFGGEILVGGLEMHNTPIDLMAIFKDHAHPHADAKINTLIQKMWDSRIDLTQISEDILKKAG